MWETEEGGECSSCFAILAVRSAPPCLVAIASAQFPSALLPQANKYNRANRIVEAVAVRI